MRGHSPAATRRGRAPASPAAVLARLRAACGDGWWGAESRLPPGLAREIRRDCGLPDGRQSDWAWLGRRDGQMLVRFGRVIVAYDDASTALPGPGTVEQGTAGGEARPDTPPSAVYVLTSADVLIPEGAASRGGDVPPRSDAGGTRGPTADPAWVRALGGAVLQVWPPDDGPWRLVVADGTERLEAVLPFARLRAHAACGIVQRAAPDPPESPFRAGARRQIALAAVWVDAWRRSLRAAWRRFRDDGGSR